MKKPEYMEVPTKRNPDALFVSGMIRRELVQLASIGLRHDELDLVSPSLRDMYHALRKPFSYKRTDDVESSSFKSEPDGAAEGPAPEDEQGSPFN